MSSLMDQIKNSVFDGSLSSGGQVLGKQAESNTPSMHNFHHPDADIDTHACPTSILLNLNQNYNLVRSRPHLESNIPSGSIPTLYLPDGNQTDSSQMTMIISSSEGDDDDTNALHVNDIQEETETDYDDRGNEGINVAAGAVQRNGISSTEKDINALICDYGVEHLVHYDASKGLDEEDFATFAGWDLRCRSCCYST